MAPTPKPPVPLNPVGPPGQEDDEQDPLKRKVKPLQQPATPTPRAPALSPGASVPSAPRPAKPLQSANVHAPMPFDMGGDREEPWLTDPKQQMAYMRQHADGNWDSVSRMNPETLSAAYRLVSNATREGVRLHFSSGKRDGGGTSFHDHGDALDVVIPGERDGSLEALRKIERWAAGTGFQSALNEYLQEVRDGGPKGRGTGGTGPHIHLVRGIDGKSYSDWGEGHWAQIREYSRTATHAKQETLRDRARVIARAYGVPEDLFLNLVQQESGFNPTAVSQVGAYGLGQLMPENIPTAIKGVTGATGAELEKLVRLYHNPDDPQAAILQLKTAAWWLREEINNTKLLPDSGGKASLPRAIAAYNAGAGHVAKVVKGATLYDETKDYVYKVMGISPDQVYRAVRDPGYKTWDTDKARKSVDTDIQDQFSLFNQTFQNTMGLLPYATGAGWTQDMQPVYGQLSGTVDDQEFMGIMGARWNRYAQNALIGIPSLFGAPYDGPTQWEHDYGPYGEMVGLREAFHMVPEGHSQTAALWNPFDWPIIPVYRGGQELNPTGYGIVDAPAKWFLGMGDLAAQMLPQLLLASVMGPGAFARTGAGRAAAAQLAKTGGAATPQMLLHYYLSQAPLRNQIMTAPFHTLSRAVIPRIFASKSPALRPLQTFLRWTAGGSDRAMHVAQEMFSDALKWGNLSGITAANMTIGQMSREGYPLWGDEDGTPGIIPSALAEYTRGAILGSTLPYWQSAAHGVVNLGATHGLSGMSRLSQTLGTAADGFPGTLEKASAILGRAGDKLTGKDDFYQSKLVQMFQDGPKSWLDYKFRGQVHGAFNTAAKWLTKQQEAIHRVWMFGLMGHIEHLDHLAALEAKATRIDRDLIPAQEANVQRSQAIIQQVHNARQQLAQLDQEVAAWPQRLQQIQQNVPGVKAAYGYYKQKSTELTASQQTLENLIQNPPQKTGNALQDKTIEAAWEAHLDHEVQKVATLQAEIANVMQNQHLERILIQEAEALEVQQRRDALANSAHILDGDQTVAFHENLIRMAKNSMQWLRADARLARYGVVINHNTVAPMAAPGLGVAGQMAQLALFPHLSPGMSHINILKKQGKVTPFPTWFWNEDLGHKPTKAISNETALRVAQEHVAAEGGLSLEEKRPLYMHGVEEPDLDNVDYTEEAARWAALEGQPLDPDLDQSLRYANAADREAQRLKALVEYLSSERTDALIRAEYFRERGLEVTAKAEEAEAEQLRLQLNRAASDADKARKHSEEWDSRVRELRPKAGTEERAQFELERESKRDRVLGMFIGHQRSREANFGKREFHGTSDAAFNRELMKQLPMESLVDAEYLLMDEVNNRRNAINRGENAVKARDKYRDAAVGKGVGEHELQKDPKYRQLVEQARVATQDPEYQNGLLYRAQLNSLRKEIKSRQGWKQKYEFSKSIVAESETANVVERLAEQLGAEDVEAAVNKRIGEMEGGMIFDPHANHGKGGMVSVDTMNDAFNRNPSAERLSEEQVHARMRILEDLVAQKRDAQAEAGPHAGRRVFAEGGWVNRRDEHGNIQFREDGTPKKRKIEGSGSLTRPERIRNMSDADLLKEIEDFAGYGAFEQQGQLDALYQEYVERMVDKHRRSRDSKQTKEFDALKDRVFDKSNRNQEDRTAAIIAAYKDWRAAQARIREFTAGEPTLEAQLKPDAKRTQIIRNKQGQEIDRFDLPAYRQRIRDEDGNVVGEGSVSLWNVSMSAREWKKFFGKIGVLQKGRALVRKLTDTGTDDPLFQMPLELIMKLRKGELDTLEGQERAAYEAYLSARKMDKAFHTLLRESSWQQVNAEHLYRLQMPDKSFILDNLEAFYDPDVVRAARAKFAMLDDLELARTEIRRKRDRTGQQGGEYSYSPGMKDDIRRGRRFKADYDAEKDLGLGPTRRLPFQFMGLDYVSFQHAWETLKSGFFDADVYRDRRWRSGDEPAAPGTARSRQKATARGLHPVDQEGEWQTNLVRTLLYEQMTQNPDEASRLRYRMETPGKETIGVKDYPATYRTDFLESAYGDALATVRRKLAAENWAWDELRAQDFHNRPKSQAPAGGTSPAAQERRSQAIPDPKVMGRDNYTSPPKWNDFITFSREQGGDDSPENLRAFASQLTNDELETWGNHYKRMLEQMDKGERPAIESTIDLFSRMYQTLQDEYRSRTDWKAPELPKNVKHATMHFSYRKGETGVDGKTHWRWDRRKGWDAENTFDATRKGLRTSTTTTLGDAEVGQVVRYWSGKKAGEGQSVDVRITKIEPVSLKWSKTRIEEWSRKEGWTPEYFEKRIQPQLEAGVELYQIHFEKVDKAGSLAADAAPRPQQRTPGGAIETIQDITDLVKSSYAAKQMSREEITKAGQQLGAFMKRLEDQYANEMLQDNVPNADLRKTPEAQPAVYKHAAAKLQTLRNVYREKFSGPGGGASSAQFPDVFGPDEVAPSQAMSSMPKPKYHSVMVIDVGGKKLPATVGQADAVGKIQRFIRRDNDQKFFVLSGPAGSGKTAVIKTALAGYPEGDVLLAAPTHKARIVLGKAFGSKRVDSVTVASLTDKKKLDRGGFSRKESEQTPWDAAKLVIIDESSMINERDLSTIIEKAEKHGAKVLFLGDPAQLPPIRHSTDPNRNAPAPVFTQFKDGAHLTDIVRQTEGNPILALASILRGALDLGGKKRARVTETDSQGRGVYYHGDRPAMLDSVVEAVKEDPTTKVVTYTNKARAKWAADVAARVWPEAKGDYAPGMVVTGYTNVGVDDARGMFNVINSADYRITKISGETTNQFGVKGRWFDLEALDTADEKTQAHSPRVFLIDPEEHQRVQAEINRRFQDALAAPEYQRGRRWREYYEFLNANQSDRPFVKDSGAAKMAHQDLQREMSRYQAMLHDAQDGGNADYIKRMAAKVEELKYQEADMMGGNDVHSNAAFQRGTAITAHKAQGSTYTKVFIDEDNLNTIRNKEDLAKLMYTAVTRAREKVHLLHGAEPAPVKMTDLSGLDLDGLAREGAMQKTLLQGMEEGSPEWEAQAELVDRLREEYHRRQMGDGNGRTARPQERPPVEPYDAPDVPPPAAASATSSSPAPQEGPARPLWAEWDDKKIVQLMQTRPLRELVARRAEYENLPNDEWKTRVTGLLDHVIESKQQGAPVVFNDLQKVKKLDDVPAHYQTMARGSEELVEALGSWARNSNLPGFQGHLVDALKDLIRMVGSEKFQNMTLRILSPDDNPKWAGNTAFDTGFVDIASKTMESVVNGKPVGVRVVAHEIFHWLSQWLPDGYLQSLRAEFLRRRQEVFSQDSLARTVVEYLDTPPDDSGRRPAQSYRTLVEKHTKEKVDQYFTKVGDDAAYLNYEGAVTYNRWRNLDEYFADGLTDELENRSRELRGPDWERTGKKQETMDLVKRRSSLAFEKLSKTDQMLLYMREAYKRVKELVNRAWHVAWGQQPSLKPGNAITNIFDRMIEGQFKKQQRNSGLGGEFEAHVQFPSWKNRLDANPFRINQTTWYHGTNVPYMGKTEDKPKTMVSGTHQKVGPGVYLTASRGIGKAYAEVFRGEPQRGIYGEDVSLPSLYEAKVDVKKPLNLDLPMSSPEAQEVIQVADEWVRQRLGRESAMDLYNEWRDSINMRDYESPLEDLFELMAGWTDMGIVRDIETKRQPFNDYLAERLGYDALLHQDIGGPGSRSMEGHEALVLIGQRAKENDLRGKLPVPEGSHLLHYNPDETLQKFRRVLEPEEVQTVLKELSPAQLDYWFGYLSPEDAKAKHAETTFLERHPDLAEKLDGWERVLNETWKEDPSVSLRALRESRREKAAILGLAMAEAENGTMRTWHDLAGLLQGKHFREYGDSSLVRKDMALERADNRMVNFQESVKDLSKDLGLDGPDELVTREKLQGVINRLGLQGTITFLVALGLFGAGAAMAESEENA